MFFFHLGWPWDVTSILSLTGFWKLCSTSFIYYNITRSNCPQRMVSMWYFSFRWIPIESCWYYSISRLLPRVLVKAFTVNDRKMFFFYLKQNCSFHTLKTWCKRNWLEQNYFFLENIWTAWLSLISWSY